MDYREKSKTNSPALPQSRMLRWHFEKRPASNPEKGLRVAAMGIAFGMVNAAIRAFFQLVSNRLGLFILLLAGLFGLIVA